MDGAGRLGTATCPSVFCAVLLARTGVLGTRDPGDDLCHVSGGCLGLLLREQGQVTEDRRHSDPADRQSHRALGQRPALVKHLLRRARRLVGSCHRLEYISDLSITDSPNLLGLLSQV